MGRRRMMVCKGWTFPILAVFLAACVGEFDSGEEGLGNGVRRGQDPVRITDPAMPECTIPVSGSRYIRLSRRQLANTVSDLLNLDASGVEAWSTGMTETLSTDFDRSELFTVDRERAQDIRVAAEGFAEAAVADQLDHVVTGGSSAGEFVRNFGRQAFRRPLLAEEESAFSALFAEGETHYPNLDPFEAGIRVVIEAMLQMPDFLYRIEQDETDAGDGLLQPSGYEMASRLSYALWDSMPDAELFAAAEAGRLETEDGIRAEATRMLADPKARGMVSAFHRQWLGTGAYFGDTETISGVDAETLVGEVEAYVLEAIFREEAGYQGLISGRYAFVNEDNAENYGLNPGDYGRELRRVDNLEYRAGLLTQTGFLALNAHAGEPSPSHRGAFVIRTILGLDLPEPPNVDITLPEPSAELRTLRSRLEQKTSVDGCIGCHAQINPMGFPYERFDQRGAARDEDNGEAVDTAVSGAVAGMTVNVAGPVELAEWLGVQSAARETYARAWLTFLYGRADVEADDCYLARLGESMADESFTVQALIVELVATAPFRYRTPTEVSP
ncbi:MAG: DUF1592 domain-containing protein [Myxococcota bacterium]